VVAVILVIALVIIIVESMDSTVAVAKILRKWY